MKIDIKYSKDEKINADELITAIRELFPLMKISYKNGDINQHIYIVLDYRWRNGLR